MQPNLRKTFVASTIASLLIAPILVTGQAPDHPRERMGTLGEEHGDALSSTGAGHDAMAQGTAPRAKPLLDRTPEEMEGLDVIGADGEKVGEISEVVMEVDRQSVHMVVSSGGILGLGEMAIAVPFDELRWVGEGLQLTSSWEAVARRGEYDKERYIGFEDKDQPIRATAELWPGAVDSAYQPEATDP